MGHYHWYYKFLFEKQVRTANRMAKTIGPTGITSDFVIPILESPKLRRFALSSSALIRFPWSKLERELRQLHSRGMSHLQIYDGDIFELALAWVISIRFPQLEVIYNFHWPLEWIELLTRRSLTASFARVALRYLLRKRPSNLALTGETKRLSNYLQAKLSTNMTTYPIISTFDFPKQHKWLSRARDILIMPQRHTEMRFVEGLVREATSRGLSSQIFVSPLVWEEAVGRGTCTPELFTKVIFSPLTQMEYKRLLRNSRVTVLPYDKEYFLWGSSGKFNEAISAGSFPFAPADSAICDQSSIESSEHGINWDPKNALDRIESRLEEGFPSDLKPQTFDSLIQWLPPIRVDSRIQSGLSVPALVSILVAFWLYRPREHSRISRVKRRLTQRLPKSAFDRSFIRELPGNAKVEKALATDEKP